MMYNLFGALVFLVIGLVDIMFMQRMVYPQMRKRYEEAKVTGSQGRDIGWRGKVAHAFWLFRKTSA